MLFKNFLELQEAADSSTLIPFAYRVGRDIGNYVATEVVVAGLPFQDCPRYVMTDLKNLEAYRRNFMRGCLQKKESLEGEVSTVINAIVAVANDKGLSARGVENAVSSGYSVEIRTVLATQMELMEKRAFQDWAANGAANTESVPEESDN